MSNEKSEYDENSKTKTLLHKKIGIALILVVMFAGIVKLVLFPDRDIFAFAANSPSKIALAYYLEKYGEPSNAKKVYAMKRRLGCHEEIHVYKDEQVVMKAIFTNGKIYEVQ